MKAIRKKNGEIMFACPDKLWDLAFHRWQKDTSLPCPMPEHHLMFNKGTDFAYEIIERFEINKI
jgi:hypothetical protein